MKVVIIGGASKEEYFTDPGPDAEIWGLNAIRPKWVPRWNRMFNLHRYEHLLRDWAHGLEKEREWCAANPETPFYVLDDPWPSDWPGWIRPFPREDLVDEPVRVDYHAGSFDWLIAFALLEQEYLSSVEEIELHGVALMDSREPISAKACLEYWCGYAEGKGVKITATPDCDLFYQYHLVKSNSVYGYDDIQLIEDRT